MFGVGVVGTTNVAVAIQRYRQYRRADWMSLPGHSHAQMPRGNI